MLFDGYVLPASSFKARLSFFAYYSVLRVVSI